MAATAETADEARRVLGKRLEARLHRDALSIWELRAASGGTLRRLSLEVPVSDGVERSTVEVELPVYLWTRAGERRGAIPSLELKMSLGSNTSLDATCLEHVCDALDPRERLEHLRQWLRDAPTSAEKAVRLERLELELEEVSNREREWARLPEGLASMATPLHREWDRRDAPRAFERDAEVDALSRHLAEDRREGLFLVGAPGVGKTSLVAELVHRILQGDVSPRLQELPVWRLDGRGGTSEVAGDWRERTGRLLDAIADVGGLLLVDDLVEWLAEARRFGEATHLSHMVLPRIRSGGLSLVAEARPDELGHLERHLPTLFRELRQMPLEPMSPEQTESILERVSFRLGRQQGVRLEADARRAVLELTERFRDRGALPGSAVDLAERTARTHRDRAVEDDGERPILRPDAVFESFASQTGLPRSVLDLETDFGPNGVRQQLERAVVGQPEAIEAMVDVVSLVRAGLNPPDRPIGSFLFVGPTGVGKTQTALALAEHLFGSEDRLLRFDMTEYQDVASAGRLVGHRRGAAGVLARRLREQPFRVLLLDEIEKAHPSLFDVLLQVLGEGRLTDGLGRTVSTNHCIVVMTSNVGSDDVPSVTETLDVDAHRRRHLDAVDEVFRPEFVGRLDEIVPFRPLDASTARRILDRALDEALQREGLARREIEVDVDDAVIDHLVDVGIDARYGARPLQRAVEERVVAPLGRWLARHPARTEARLRVHLGDDGPEITELD
jgi:ATP-dependent Clp protease ATP-binding subunit ClpC